MRLCMIQNTGTFLKDRAQLEYLTEALSSISSKVIQFFLSLFIYLFIFFSNDRLFSSFLIIVDMGFHVRVQLFFYCIYLIETGIAVTISCILLVGS